MLDGQGIGLGWVVADLAAVGMIVSSASRREVDQVSEGTLGISKS